MKTVILGAENAGKTTFLTMFCHYVNTRRRDLILEPMDPFSAQYVAGILHDLECEGKLNSTRQGDVQILNWRFGRKMGNLAEIHMLDSAGQDLRAILLGNCTQGVQTTFAIRKHIDNADVLVFLLDLGSLLASQDTPTLTENAWLMKTFLTEPCWRAKKRVMILSKADLYQALLEEKNGDVKETIKQAMPSILHLSHVFDAETNVCYLPVTSFVTNLTLTSDGIPQHKPALPLASQGFDPLLETLLEMAAKLESNELKKANRLSRGAAMSATLIWVFGMFIHHKDFLGVPTSNYWPILVLFMLHAVVCNCIGGDNEDVGNAWLGSFFAATVGYFAGLLLSGALIAPVLVSILGRGELTVRLAMSVAFCFTFFCALKGVRFALKLSRRVKQH